MICDKILIFGCFFNKAFINISNFGKKEPLRRSQGKRMRMVCGFDFEL